MDNQLYAEERKQSIMDMLNETKRVQVSELTEQFQVTGSTIRNDLRELEKEGKLMRTHGGAIKRDYQRSAEISPKTREFTTEKYKIAEKAIKLIEENDTLAIDTGTSCIAFAEKLVQTNFESLSILTYDLQIALLIHEQTNYQVQVLGGVIRKGYPYVSGESVVNEMRGYSVDKVIMGTTFFDTEYGYSTPNFGTAELKKSLMDLGKTKIALCESKKIGDRSYRQFAPPDECDFLVTDSMISQHLLVELERLNTKIIVA